MNNNKFMIGDRLRACRKSMKLTQEELSTMLDVSVKHYSEVERGLAGLSVDNWIHVSEILNTSLDYLLKGVDMNTPMLLSNMFYNTDERQQEILIKIIDLVKEYKK